MQRDGVIELRVWRSRNIRQYPPLATQAIGEEVELMRPYTPGMETACGDERLLKPEVADASIIANISL